VFMRVVFISFLILGRAFALMPPHFTKVIPDPGPLTGNTIELRGYTLFEDPIVTNLNTSEKVEIKIERDSKIIDNNKEKKDPVPDGSIQHFDSIKVILPKLTVGHRIQLKVEGIDDENLIWTITTK